MNPKALAVVLMRSSGVISIVVGLCHAIGYLPMVKDVIGPDARPSAGSGAVYRTLFLPSLAGIVGGLILILFASWFARLVARGLNEPVA